MKRQSTKIMIELFSDYEQTAEICGFVNIEKTIQSNLVPNIYYSIMQQAKQIGGVI